MAKKEATGKQKAEAVFENWRKIKWNEAKGVMTLEYTEREPGAKEADNVAKIFHNRPRNKFLQALQELRQHVAAFICMTAAEKAKVIDQLEIRGVNFTLDENGELAQLVVVRRIPQGDRKAPLNFNTPRMYCFCEEEEEDLSVWSSDCVDVLDKLKDAAREYLDGDREPVSELTGQPASKDGPLAKGLKGDDGGEEEDEAA